MAVLVLIGIATTLVATEPEKSANADASPCAGKITCNASSKRRSAHSPNSSRAIWSCVVLAFVVLFKFTDALSGAMTAPFVIDLGFSRNEYAAIIKGVGLAATLIGGFAGGFVARAFSLPASLWLGGVLQGLANLAFSWQAVVGLNAAWLTFAIVAENFTSAIGTVIFVAYLSALCRNPLHTATQYALLTALAAFGRTYLSSGAGFIAAATGWPWFFAICAVSGMPALLLLAWLQQRGHFDGLGPAADPEVTCATKRNRRLRTRSSVCDAFAQVFAPAKKSFCKDQIAIIAVVPLRPSNPAAPPFQSQSLWTPSWSSFLRRRWR